MAVHAINERQHEVGKGICNGLTAKQIAKTLNIEPCTVIYHIENLKKIYHVANKTALAAALVATNVVKKTELKHLVVGFAIGAGEVQNYQSPSEDDLKRPVVARVTKLQRKNEMPLPFPLDINYPRDQAAA